MKLKAWITSGWNSITATVEGTKTALDTYVVNTVTSAIKASNGDNLTATGTSLDVNVTNAGGGSGDAELVGTAHTAPPNTETRSVVPIGGFDSLYKVIAAKFRDNGRLTTEATDYFLTIKKGDIAAHDWYDTTAAIDYATSGVDVLVSEGAFNEIPIGDTWSVVSVSTNDTLLGTGARRVEIDFYNEAGVPNTQIVDLNGTTPVNMTGSATKLRLQNAHCVVPNGVGALEKNDGDIQIWSGLNGTGTLLGEIKAGSVRLNRLIFYTGTNEVGYIVFSSSVTNDKPITCTIETHENVGATMTSPRACVNKGYFSSGKDGGGAFSQVIMVPARSMVEVYGNAEVVSTAGKFSAEMYIERDGA